MFRINSLLAILVIMLALSACNKKSHPSKTEESSGTVKKEPVKARPKTTVAKVIVVNDNVAKRSVDGRHYYDLMGHRYWKNYKDGKYYLFNKSMFSDPDFKARIE